MSKKYGTKKVKEKKIPERELIGGEYYLIDEKKCLYRSTEGACQCLTGIELLHIVFISEVKWSSYLAPFKN